MLVADAKSSLSIRSSGIPTLEMLAEYWSKVNEGIVKQMAVRGNQLVSIRYEELIMQPHKITAKLMNFCELSGFDFKHFQQDTASKHVHRINPASGASIKHYPGRYVANSVTIAMHPNWHGVFTCLDPRLR